MKRYALTFGLALIGAGGASLLNLPLPWMVGPLFTLTVLSVAGGRFSFPDRIKQPTFAMVGVYLGSSLAQGGALFEPAWIATMLIMIAFTLAASYLSYLYFRLAASYSPKESFLSALPGALAFISVYIVENKLPPAKIILSQSIRVALVVGLMPFFYAWYSGNEPNDINTVKPVAFVAPWLFDLVLTTLISVPVIWLARKISLPNAWFLGGMFASSTCYAFGLADQKLPAIILQILLVLIGTMIGVRFAGTRLRELLTAVFHGILSAVILLAFTFAVVFASASLLETNVIKLLLAFAPGGVHEMAIIAFAYSVEPIFVTFHHVLRIFVISFLIPLIINRLR